MYTNTLTTMNILTTIQFYDKVLSLQDKLYTFALSLANNAEDAEDLLQETTLKALKNQDKFVNNINFKGWMFTIMRNIFINNYRKHVNSQTLIDNTKDLYHLNLPQDSGFETPESAYSINEINKVINSFSDDYKKPFTMHVAGFKYKEIAEDMELPIGTVKSRIFFARKRLMEQLKDFK